MPPSSAEIVRMRRDLARVRRAITANLAVIQARTEQGKQLIEEREAIRFALKDVEHGDPPCCDGVRDWRPYNGMLQCQHCGELFEEEGDGNDPTDHPLCRRPPALDEPAPVGVPAQGDVFQPQGGAPAPAPAHGDV